MRFQRRSQSPAASSRTDFPAPLKKPMTRNPKSNTIALDTRILGSIEHEIGGVWEHILNCWFVGV